MAGAIAAAAKALLKKLAIDLALDKEKRNKFLMIVGSIAVGLLFLLFAPIAVLSTMSNIEPPSYNDHQLDGEAFLSQLTPEQQNKIAVTEADGQVYAER